MYVEMAYGLTVLLIHVVAGSFIVEISSSSLNQQAVRSLMGDN